MTTLPTRRRSSLDRRSARLLALVPCLLLCVSGSLGEQGAPAPQGGGAPDVNWVIGPASGDLGGIATVGVPEGFIFAGPDDTRELMEMMQNPTDGTEKGFIAPADSEWFVVFEFDAIGYVKDDEKAALEADAILESLRAGQTAGNEARKQRGWETLEITGWMDPPHYDAESNNLEWATKLRSSNGTENVNYNSRLLGRRGVMSATLVGSEQDVRGSLPAFKAILVGHQYVTGQTYAEFRSGDKLAQYGLTALITGGAAAVALKTGLLQKFWKLIVVAVVGGLAAIRKLFRRTPQSQEGGPASA